MHGSSKSISTHALSTAEIPVRPLSRWLTVQVLKHAWYYSKDKPKNEAGPQIQEIRQLQENKCEVRD